MPIWTAYEVVTLWLFANGHIPWLQWAQHPLWFVALMLLGNFAIAGYALLCLYQAPADAGLDATFFTRKQS